VDRPAGGGERTALHLGGQGYNYSFGQEFGDYMEAFASFFLIPWCWFEIIWYNDSVLRSRTSRSAQYMRRPRDEEGLHFPARVPWRKWVS
jgi:hypothetical protein